VADAEHEIAGLALDQQLVLRGVVGSLPPAVGARELVERGGDASVRQAWCDVQLCRQRRGAHVTDLEWYGELDLGSEERARRRGQPPCELVRARPERWGDRGRQRELKRHARARGAGRNGDRDAELLARARAIAATA